MLITPLTLQIRIFGVAILGRVQVRPGSHGSARFDGGCPPMYIGKLEKSHTIEYCVNLQISNLTLLNKFCIIFRGMHKTALNHTNAELNA